MCPRRTRCSFRAWNKHRKFRLEDRDQLLVDVDLEVGVRTVFYSVEATLLALLGTSAEAPRW